MDTKSRLQFYQDCANKRAAAGATAIGLLRVMLSGDDVPKYMIPLVETALAKWDEGFAVPPEPIQLKA